MTADAATQTFSTVGVGENKNSRVLTRIFRNRRRLIRVRELSQFGRLYSEMDVWPTSTLFIETPFPGHLTLSKDRCSRLLVRTTGS